MTNFSFLYTKSTYTLFAPACIEAEQIFAASPALCAVGCWKALELAVEWVDAVETSIEMFCRNKCYAFLYQSSFCFV